VTSYIDGVGRSFNDGITWLRGESGHPVLVTVDRLFLLDLSDNRVVSPNPKTTPTTNSSSPSAGIPMASRSMSRRDTFTAKGGNDMSDKIIRSIAAIGASAVVTVGAVAVATLQDLSSIDADAGSAMSTGVTVTESVAPTTPPVARATPGITGAAPLPPEEQGVPG
jgi:hypothetical protein